MLYCNQLMYFNHVNIMQYKHSDFDWEETSVRLLSVCIY